MNSKDERDYEENGTDIDLFYAMLRAYDDELLGEDIYEYDEGDDDDAPDDDMEPNYIEILHEDAKEAFKKLNFTEAFVVSMRACAAAIANEHVDTLREVFFGKERFSDSLYFKGLGGLVDSTRILYADIVRNNDLRAGIRTTKQSLFRSIMMDAMASLTTAIATVISNAIEEGEVSSGDVETNAVRMKVLADEIRTELKQAHERGEIDDEQLAAHEKLFKELGKRVLKADDAVERLFTWWMYIMTMIYNAVVDGMRAREIVDGCFGLLVKSGLPEDFVFSTIGASSSDSKKVEGFLSFSKDDNGEISFSIEKAEEGDEVDGVAIDEWAEEHRSLLEMLHEVLEEEEKDE